MLSVDAMCRIVGSLVVCYAYAAGECSKGPEVGWKAILRKWIGFVIFAEMPAEKAEICSWMYVKKVSVDHGTSSL